MEINKFWNEIASRDFAHLEPIKGKGLDPDSPVLAIYKKEFLNKIDFTNKKLIEYGIGGGYFPLYLFKNNKLGYYIGIDIAQRSIEVTKKILQQYKNKCSFYLSPISFSQFNADIFVSFACIQHFPSKEYFDDFLQNINTSNIKELILQIRYNEETIFNNAYEITYENNEAIRLACKTNSNYMGDKLNNYSLIYESEVLKKTNYQYLIYRRI